MSGPRTEWLHDDGVARMRHDARSAQTFPFVIEFEHHGRTAVMRDALVCEYQGVTRGPDCSPADDWNQRLASGAAHATLAESAGIRIDYGLPLCEMLVEGDIPSTHTDVYVDTPNGRRYLTSASFWNSTASGLPASRCSTVQGQSRSNLAWVRGRFKNELP